MDQQETSGGIVKRQPNTLAEFRVSLGMMRLKPWEWGELAPLRAQLGPDLQRSLPLAISHAQSELAGSTAEEFKATLKPALDLVCPVGMERAARGDWIKAATLMLAGVPHDLLARGCRIAMETCDHPSKIVPTILKAIDEPWRARKRALYDLNRLAEMAQRDPVIEDWQRERPALIEPEAISVAPPAKTEATIADYVALGLTEEEARQAMADRERMLRRSPAKPFASAAAVALNDASRAA